MHHNNTCTRYLSGYTANTFRLYLYTVVSSNKSPSHATEKMGELNVYHIETTILAVNGSINSLYVSFGKNGMYSGGRGVCVEATTLLDLLYLLDQIQSLPKFCLPMQARVISF